MAKDSEKDNLLLLNWNSNGISNKSIELQQFLEDKQIDIACITETHLTSNKKLFVPGFTIYRRDRPDKAGGGVAVMIRKNIRHRAINTDIPHSEAVGIEIYTKTSPIRIITYYSPPNSNQKFSTLNPLFETNTPTIVAGDLNAKHTSWGSKHNNPAGQSLLKKLLKLNINIEPPSEPTLKVLFYIV